MYVHLRGQLKACAVPKRATPPHPKPPTTTQSPPSEAHPTTACPPLATCWWSYKGSFKNFGRSPDGISILADPPNWLKMVLSSDIPPEFQGEVVAQGPLSPDPLPQGAVATLKLIFEGTPPLYLGVYRDRSLVVTASASQDMVTDTLRFPPDTTAPRLHR
ncbi:hypothetical protein EDC04DRAFT_2603038 [Pisolithus marmoratus]|nr:hypothetical protein EDC04DRAFT_2603038 [Pisolithus marmoratus]